MPCKNAQAVYRFYYPSKDVEGNDLVALKGATIEALTPGATDWVKVGEVAFPGLEFTYNVHDDGQYALRHRIVSYTVIQDVVQGGTCLTVGEASDPTVFQVKVAAPVKPAKGGVMVPCPCGDD